MPQINSKTDSSKMYECDECGKMFLTWGRRREQGESRLCKDHQIKHPRGKKSYYD